MDRRIEMRTDRQTDDQCDFYILRGHKNMRDIDPKALNCGPVFVLNNVNKSSNVKLY